MLIEWYNNKTNEITDGNFILTLNWTNFIILLMTFSKLNFVSAGHQNLLSIINHN